MKNFSLLPVALVAFTSFACAPAASTVPSPAGQPAVVRASEAPVLRPTGYRPEFGTMWTFDAPPLDYWRSTYNFSPDKAWLDHVRLAAVRLPNCSASFVSANGLVITNHHCVRGCASAVSPRDTNYIETGFVARGMGEEKKCPGFYVDQLESIENVTGRVRAGITATTAEAQAHQRTEVTAQIETECNRQTGLTCQVVSLYQGGMYSLYRYKRYDDLRLVFAPEDQVASFGGDPDNFTYPRYDLDAGILRVYVNDQPHKPDNYLRWSTSGAGDGEPVFVVGNPGSTGRLNTIAQMQFLRDYQYPAQLAGYERTLAIYRELARTDPAAARRYENNVFSLENSRKAVTGYRSGLTDSVYMATKAAFEREFRARLAADSRLSAQYSGTYDAIAAAQRELASFDAVRRNRSFGPTVPAGGSRLLNMAGQLVRLPVESALPDSARLAAYRGNLANTIRASLLRDQPIDSAFERLAIAAQLRAVQAELSADDPFLRATLAGRTPEQAAAALVSGTHVGDVAFRRSLVEGGAAAVAATDDPMIALARRIDPLNREVLARADRLNAVITSNTEKVGRALFETYGTALPPDATFTLRISDGVVKGYPMNGTIAPYKTVFMGMYSRSAEFDGRPPFDLPRRWTDRKDRLDLTTPFNFVSTTDIIGGNSGSPVINRNGEVVGLAFDGNIEGVANRFLYQSEKQRTVSVSSQSIVEALRKVYDAAALATELQGR
ncbi:MAG: S46 family peptidase [Gemmatimonadaceae bacterium]|nr:S46 family peptidase [Gemmatimonadaceae bacterium]